MIYNYICLFYYTPSYLNNRLYNCANVLNNGLFQKKFSLLTNTLLNIAPYPTYFPHFRIDNIVSSSSPTASNVSVILYSTIS